MDGLEKYPFYKDLTEKEREMYAGSVQERAFLRGETVHRGYCTGSFMSNPEDCASIRFRKKAGK